MTGVSAEMIAEWGNALLGAETFRDYAPHGLQVAGTRPIRRVVSGVSANAALIAAGAERSADALLVHHGFFWEREPRALVGYRGERVRSLMVSGMALIAWHLPLDAHPEVGNNACLLREAGATPRGILGDDKPGIARWGELEQAEETRAVLARLAGALDQEPVAFLHGSARVKRIGVCSGGGAGWFEAALAAGCDLFVTGEPSEQSQGIARECRGNFAAFGHHATERGGVRALGERLAAHFGVEVEYVDVPNPV